MGNFFWSVLNVEDISTEELRLTKLIKRIFRISRQTQSSCSFFPILRMKLSNYFSELISFPGFRIRMTLRDFIMRLSRISARLVHFLTILSIQIVYLDIQSDFYLYFAYTIWMWRIKPEITSWSTPKSFKIHFIWFLWLINVAPLVQK